MPIPEKIRVPAEPPAGRRRRGLVVASVTIGLCGFALVALSQTRPAILSTSRSLPRNSELALPTHDLSGFQQRGNTLVGDVTTPEGTRLRLVLDARTHQVIGIRKMTDENDGAASSRGPRAGAHNGAHDGAPLPETAHSAN